MSNESENEEEEYELNWKELHKGGPKSVRLNVALQTKGPSPSLTLTLYGWQMKLVTSALCGRLQEGHLPAKLLGLKMRIAYFKANLSVGGAEGMIKQCEEEIAEIYNSVEMQKMQLDVWAKEQARLSEISED
jgi:hypothetical protein